MKALRVILCISTLLASVCTSRAEPAADDGQSTDRAMLLPQHHQVNASGPTFNLDEIEQMALAANPEIRDKALRVHECWNAPRRTTSS